MMPLAEATRVPLGEDVLMGDERLVFFVIRDRISNKDHVRSIFDRDGLYLIR